MTEKKPRYIAKHELGWCELYLMACGHIQRLTRENERLHQELMEALETIALLADDIEEGEQ